ncbi:MAG: ferritin [Desulfurococcales archaeon]|nr:ferritin [Desulfurococcales archaeon]
MDKRILELLNKQLNAELYSAYLYLSMAAYLDHKGLPGFAKWMRIQAKEEVEHAMKFYEYINDRGERVVLEAIEKPPTEWESITQLFEEGLKHEKSVTDSINKIFEAARELGDKPTEVFLHWFIDEQVEEEKTFSEILGMLKLTQEQPHALLMLDSRLAQRED